MTPRRVLLFSEYFLPHRGGIEMHVHALARRLRRHGVEAEVATPFPGPDTVDGIRVHRLRTPLFPRFRTVWTTHAAEPFLRLLREGDFGLMHCHHSIFNPAATGAVFLAQRMGFPTVVTLHSILRGYAPAFGLLDRFTGWSRWPVTFTAVSGVVAEHLSPLLGGGPVRVLPNGIDPAEWVPPDPRPAGDAFRVVTAMRLARRKRPRALIEMLALLRERLPHAMRLRARIVGEGSERAALHRLIAERGLTEEVELCGQLTHERMRDEYARADVFVLPSLEESFGIAALEARAAGLPVVVMRDGGPADFIRHEREGLLADSDADMVAALVRLARDPALRERIALHNRSTPSPYGWDEVLRLHLDAYAAATAPRAAG